MHSKKLIVLLLAFVLMIGLGTVAHATTFGNDKNGAFNVEVLNVKYNGAAWNYSGSGYSWASFTYSRNGVCLLTEKAYSGKVTGSVWDNLIHWGDEYTTKFNWNRG